MASVMLDLETLATTPDAVIVTFGAVKFDPYSNDDPSTGVYFRIDADSQIAMGRRVCDDTLAWWMKQKPEIQDEAFSPEDRIDLETFCTELNRFVANADDIWCQGPVFDIVLLENLYRMLGKPAPWQYWQIRDSRTIFGMKPEMRIVDKDAHNALADCYMQARSIQKIYNHLGITKPDRFKNAS